MQHLEKQTLERLLMLVNVRCSLVSWPLLDEAPLLMVPLAHVPSLGWGARSAVGCRAVLSPSQCAGRRELMA